MKSLWKVLALSVIVSMLLVSCAVPPPPVAQAPAPAAAEAVAPTAAPAPEPTAVPEPEPTAMPEPEPTAAPAQEDIPRGTLFSMMTDAAPVLDGVGDDAGWANAPMSTFEVAKGANMGETVINVQSLYTDDMIYFLLSWADPTESFVRSPWQKQADGSWAKLKDPDDIGGDNNIYYEDKMSFIWNINNSIPKFERTGCNTACHLAKDDDTSGKPYGNKYTDEGMGDIWHWKSVRNVGQVDDQYLDNTPWSTEFPSAGRHSDPKDGGGYVNNESEDKTMPMWMGPADAPKDGAPGYILEDEKLPFDDTLFVAGDMVPGITTSPMTGDRGDISAGWVYADGMWTLEIGRALVTGSEFDVQFDDLSMPYHFGLAIFDNAQVRHAFDSRPATLIFK